MICSAFSVNSGKIYASPIAVSQLLFPPHFEYFPMNAACYLTNNQKSFDPNILWLNLLYAFHLKEFLF